MQLNAKEYKRNGWIKIYSKLINRKFYLVRNLEVKVPDDSLLRVTQRGLQTLGGLKSNEIQQLFEAAEILCSNVYDATIETASKQRKQKRVDRPRQQIRKRVRQATHEARC
jgi:hypothetical protein